MEIEVEVDELDTLESVIQSVQGDMQKELESARTLEGGGPEYLYTSEDVENDILAEGGLASDDSTTASARDIAHLEKGV